MFGVMKPVEKLAQAEVFMNYDLARNYAEIFAVRLAPFCERIEVVGSVKRNDKPEVHDIEILLIQKQGHPIPEFGKPNIYTNWIDKAMADLEYEGLLRQAADKKDGDRYKKRAIVGTGELNEFCLDLFIVTPTTWGLQNLIRTGPSLFSHRAVTNQRALAFDRETGNQYFGFLPDHLKYVRAKDAPDKLSRVMRGTEVLKLPEERDAIEMLGFGWIPPNERREFSIRQNAISAKSGYK